MKQFFRLNLLAGLIVIILGSILLWVFQPSQNPAIVMKNLEGYSKAYFAGGCFWSMEKAFEKVEGVEEVLSGYMGGELQKPTYSNHGDHRESIEVYYDPEQLSYEDLVHHFFRSHDPTDEGGSFYDRGYEYTSAIYPQSEDEQDIAAEVLEAVGQQEVFPDPIVTVIEKDKTFWPAEEYHQDYYKKKSLHYERYRVASGRPEFFESIWGEDLVYEGITIKDHPWKSFEKPSDEELQKALSELSYTVTQEDGTEAPFTEGNFDQNKEQGIYVDIVSGEPLFSSRDKYDSGTGWPSFTQPISTEFIVTKEDRKLITPRIEVRSRYADSHLGHVFPDGPSPLGLRWCINGAALRFISLEDMEAEGYNDYLEYVEEKIG